MTIKDIKKLVINSYTKGKLDQKKTDIIAKNLSRPDLKQYIKQLKLENSKQSVTVYISDMSARPETLSKVSKMFPNKQITILEDKELLGGIKIVDYDMVYEDSLKNTLSSMVSYITN